MKLRNVLFALTFPAMVIGCSAAPAPTGGDTDEAVASAAAALTCPAGQVKSCAYSPDVQRVECECVEKTGGSGGPVLQPWSGETISIAEHSHAFGGWATITGAHWQAGDTVDVFVHFGCGQNTQQVATATVAWDGSFTTNTNDVWRLCNQSLAYFELKSRNTTADLTQSTWIYWTR